MIINLTSNIDNASLQVGDQAVWVNIYDQTSNISGNVTGGGNYTSFVSAGTITAIGSDYVETDGGNLPPANSFLMFHKPDQVNNVGLKGYFAEVTLRNNSREDAELYALSSEVVESSK